MIGFNNFRKKSNISIGVVGVKRGYGVTHLCLTFANYLKSREGFDVLYIKLGGRFEVMELVDKKQITIGNTAGYRYKGVNYIFAKDKDETIQIMNSFKGAIVVDIDILDENTKKVFDFCKKKYVIGSLQPWCSREYIKFISDNLIIEYDMKQIVFLSKGQFKLESRKMFELYGCVAKKYPFLENPFNIQEKDFNIINNLLWLQKGEWDKLVLSKHPAYIR